MARADRPGLRPDGVADSRGCGWRGLAAGSTGVAPSKPSIRVAWSHSPHHGSRAGRAGARAARRVDSRAASTEYGFRTPLVSASATAASVRGDQPALSAVVTARASLARGAAVSRQPGPSAAKNSPAGPSSCPSTACVSPTRARAAGSLDGSLDGSGATAAPRGCTGCTRRRAGCTPFPARGCNCRTPPGQLPTASPPVATGAVIAPRQPDCQRPVRARRPAPRRSPGAAPQACCW